MTESTAGLTIVIGSYLEADQVARIAAAPPVARVAYEPDLLPVPRYRCDHGGRRRDLSEGDLARWRSIAASADVFFDFDWLDPAGMADLAKNGRLRWVQATSAGIGAFMQRTGLDRSGLTATTAAASTRCRWPSSRSWAPCTSSRACPTCGSGSRRGTGSGTRPGSSRASGRSWSASAASAAG